MNATQGFVSLVTCGAGLCRAAMVLISLSATVCGAAEPETDPLQAAFDAVDANKGGKVTREEFEAAADDPDVARRDFWLVDVDRNGRLSLDEFAMIPGMAPASRRVATPNPLDHLLDASLGALEETWKEVRNPEGESVDTTVFTMVLVRSISPDHSTARADKLASAVDIDGDGKVSPQEAHRFLEIEVGLRAPSGELLHRADGRVVNFAEFDQLDFNGNLKIDKDEYAYDRPLEVANSEFAAIDRDHDGLITIEEFSEESNSGLFDPLVWFRDADVNLDALVDVDEAEAATEEARKPLIEPSFRAFDHDGDGKLDLEEYRVSMLGNPIAAWESPAVDWDDDGSLSLAEFQSSYGAGDLLQLFYFHRLDLNLDEKLSQKEFFFRSRPAGTFKLLAADGSELRPLYSNSEYPHCGSPAVSPDGETIAFDGRRAGQGLQDQRILMIDRNGGSFRDVCGGLMPTWSKDGRQFACSRYAPRQGVWNVNADGSGARWIANGWGAQWSPDGKTIAFTRGREIWAYDLTTAETIRILSAEEHPYQRIYWNMGWSPDSQRLVFKGRKNRGNDIASISMVGDDRDLTVHLATDLRVEPDFAWSPDGERILFCMEARDHPNDLLYELDPQTNDPPQLVKGIDQRMFHNDCCFTPDGRWIVVGATKSAELGL